MKYLAGIVCFFALCFCIWPGGQSEAGGSQTRGKYMVEQGQVIPADQIIMESYLAQVDYHYPDPETDLSVTFLPARNLVSPGNRDMIIQLGFQGKRGTHDELPVLNLCFLVDLSGSMMVEDKIDWVKAGLVMYLEKIRALDILSIVTTTEKGAVVLQPPVKGRDISSPSLLEARIRDMKPYGKTALLPGLEKAYALLKQQYAPNQVNRVILLSDGLVEDEGLLQLADKYRKKGINLTTIGFGAKFNLGLMIDLATEGGGSSRFAADHAKLVEFFDSDIGRMVVPAARDLRFSVTLAPGVTGIRTWGYDYALEGDTVSYYLSTLHFRDYETTLISCRLPEKLPQGRFRLAQLAVEYTDLQGKRIKLPRSSLYVTGTAEQHGLSAISHPMVLRAGTIMHLALAMQDIGDLFYSARDRSLLDIYAQADFQVCDITTDTVMDRLAGREREEVTWHLDRRLPRAMDLTLLSLGELANTRLRLGEEMFPDETNIMLKYVDIIGRAGRIYGADLEALKQEQEIRRAYPQVPMDKALNTLLAEALFPAGSKAAVVFDGFMDVGSQVSHLQSTVNRLAAEVLRGQRNVQVALPQTPLGSEEGGISETGKALALGRKGTAEYLLTGKIHKQQWSVQIFTRLINCSTGELVSVAQVVLPAVE